MSLTDKPFGSPPAATAMANPRACANRSMASAAPLAELAAMNRRKTG